MNNNSVDSRFTGANWRKSSRSASTGECVELTTVPGWIGIRDSKLGATSPTLAFTPTQWKTFFLGVTDSKCD